MDDFEAEWGPATRAIRIGHVRTPESEHSEPIFPTSSYVFSSAAEAAATFGGERKGNIYSRFTNPTVRTFEQRLAALEGGESCVATASGMAAILATCMGVLAAGDHMVSSARAAMSPTSVSGLDGVSMNRSRVCGRIAASQAARSVRGTKLVSTPKRDR